MGCEALKGVVSHTAWPWTLPREETEEVAVCIGVSMRNAALQSPWLGLCTLLSEGLFRHNQVRVAEPYVLEAGRELAPVVAGHSGSPMSTASPCMHVPGLHMVPYSCSCG